jgi:hypothetical protein
VGENGRGKMKVDDFFWRKTKKVQIWSKTNPSGMLVWGCDGDGGQIGLLDTPVQGSVGLDKSSRKAG